MTKTYCAGVDVGSSYTKAVLIGPDAEVVSSCVLRTGSDFQKVSRRALRKVLDAAAGVAARRVVSTGVGRSSCAATQDQMTEITCLARGSFHFCPRPHTAVDIGGQDNKVVAVDGRGRQTAFKMNRKCAAGTGAFLEEIARRLDIPVRRMDLLARSAQGRVEIGSFCTVFTCTEIIHHIREGKRAPEILGGCYESVVKRILEMDPLQGELVLAGGVVSNHPAVAQIFREKLGREPIVPPHPQLVGALGAALLAMENHGKNDR
ncbi:MAG: ATPase [Elusimicrobia bacterium]|nr:ATPase [Elusimicrobiota bacterium]